MNGGHGNDPRESARAIRVGAGLLTLATSPLFSIFWSLPAQVRTAALLLDVATVATYGLCALAATPSRSLGALRVIGVIMGLAVGASTTVRAVLVPELTWEGTLFAMASLVGFAGIAPWPLTYHAAVALPVSAGMIAAVQLYWERLPLHPEWVHLRIYAVLLVALLAGFGIAWLRTRMQRAIRISEERFRLLFENAGDAMVLATADGLIRNVNPAFASLIGKPASDLVGNRLTRYVEFVIEGTEERYTAEPRIWRSIVIRADGSQRDAESVLARTVAGDEPLIQVVVRDVSARLAAERRRAEQDRLDALSRMSAGLAHQFNNLLGGILTSASDLRERLAGDEHAAALDEIIESVRRGRTLTKALQRFTPHSAVTLVEVDPVAIVESAAALIRVSLPRDVRFGTSVQTDLPRIAADQDHLVQACFELAVNAYRALQGVRDPQLELAVTASEPGRVRFTMKDNGTGMDAATRAKALEPFFSTRPMFESAGLGLASVYWVARAHGGTLDIESAPGQGTAVHLEIPVRATEAQALAGPAPRERVVLVVDDEEAVRQPLRRALPRLGFRMKEASDGASALDVLRQPEPLDLVILDIVLPGGGLDLLRDIMRLRPDTKVLLSSGYGPEGEAAVMLAAGAHGFLQKPYELAELRAAIERVMGTGRS